MATAPLTLGFKISDEQVTQRLLKFVTEVDYKRAQKLWYKLATSPNYESVLKLIKAVNTTPDHVRHAYSDLRSTGS
jgi:hypothetical protein